MLEEEEEEEAVVVLVVGALLVVVGSPAADPLLRAPHSHTLHVEKLQIRFFFFTRNRGREQFGCWAEPCGEELGMVDLLTFIKTPSYFTHNEMDAFLTGCLLFLLNVNLKTLSQFKHGAGQSQPCVL